jgi:hypothetical protein
LIGVVLFLLTITALAYADENCKGFTVDDTCYFTINGNFKLDTAKEKCISEDGTLAVIKTYPVFEAAKAYIRANFDSKSKMSVYWLDQKFDYKARKTQFPDGSLISEAEFAKMWYRGQPCMTTTTPDMVLVFRNPAYLLDNPNLENYQGFYTIGANSAWNALCIAN